jgi:general secretion pathway protein B
VCLARRCSQRTNERSFILDALKKSETERQRGAVPGISDLPVVVQQTRTSAWVGVVIAGLGVCIVALGWAWWQSADRASQAAVVRTAAPAPVRSEPAPAQPVRTARVPAAEAAPPVATRSLAQEVAQAPAPARAAPSAAATPSPSARDLPSGSGTVTASPMSILEARSAGMPVPELTLELLVYSNNPGQRFVYINSAKYVEGETLADGPRVVEITPEGAILSWRNQNFLLPQN